MAGLNDVAMTIASRAIVFRMRRRAAAETVEPYRLRVHEPQGLAIGEQLAAAVEALQVPDDPALPAGVPDRPADVWEPLLAIAQAAGGAWSERAAAACTHLVGQTRPAESSLSLALLEDVRAQFSGGR
jgi:hypothetical protein